MSSRNFHFIDIDGVLVEQPIRYKDYSKEEEFTEAVKKKKRIQSIINNVKNTKGIHLFCTGRKKSTLEGFTYNQLIAMFQTRNVKVIFYPENREYRPWEIYNIWKLLILEREYRSFQYEAFVEIDKIHIWEDSIWVIQAIIKYTTIPLEKFVFNHIHKQDGEYVINEIDPANIDNIVAKIEARLEK